MHGDSVCEEIQKIVNLYEKGEIAAEVAMRDISTLLDSWDEYASWGEDR